MKNNNLNDNFVIRFIFINLHCKDISKKNISCKKKKLKKKINSSKKNLII